MAAYATVQEIVCIREVMTKLGLTYFELSNCASQTPLNVESKSVIDSTQNPVSYKRSKHKRTEISLDSQASEMWCSEASPCTHS